MSNIKKIYICIFLLFINTYIVNTGIIQPDKQNPIVIKNPYLNKQNQEITFKFSLPYNTNGLAFGYFMGIVFPKTMRDTLKFNLIDRFKCELTSIQESKRIKLSMISSTSLSSLTEDESNIAFCQLIEERLSPLGSNSKFELSIIFQFQLNISYIENISIFTSTSNLYDRIIIDYNSSFGSISFYNLITIDSPNSIKYIEMTSIKYTITEGADKSKINPIIYVYNKFNMELLLRCNKYLNTYDIYIVIDFPSTMIKAPTLMKVSVKENDLATEYLYIDNIKYSYIEGRGMIIEGINQLLYQGKQIKIEMNDLQAMDNNINKEEQIHLRLYYKNTFSLLSSSSINSFKIVPIQIDLSVNHPEFWDIYSNSASPFRFQIKINNSISSIGYLLLQHSNLIPSQRRFNFVSSTCDFSENSKSFENGFGKRRNCFALNNQFVVNSSGDGSGSGILFQFSGLNSGDTLYLTVWGYADACGLSYDPSNDIANTSWEKFEFKASIYKDIHLNSLNENRIFFENNQLLAVSSKVLMGNKCWNSYISGQSSYLKIGERYGNTVSGAVGTDYMLYKEITDFITTDVNDLTCTDCLVYDSFTNGISSNGYTQFSSERFLYSSSKSVSNGSFFNLSANIPKDSSSDRLSLYLPGPFNSSGQYIPGRLQFVFSRKWVIGGNDYRPNKPTSCYISWSTINDWTTKSNNSPIGMIINDGNSGSGGNKNFLHTISMMDTNATQLPPQIQFNTGVNTIYKIVSNYESANGPGGGSPGSRSILSWFVNPIGVSPTTPPTVSYGQISIFTTCLRWNTSLPEIKSIYEYLDMQVHWISTQNSSALSPITKVIRFIKLYIEGGVFQDYTSNTYTHPIGVKLLYNHYSYGESVSNTGVCILEINGKALQESSNKSSNTILIFIKNAFLLEADIIDSSSQYPVIPVISNIKTYSLSSGLGISSENHLSKGVNLTSLSTPNTHYDYMRSLYNQPPFLPNRSIYHNYLSSIVILNGISSNSVTTQSFTNQPNLHIPYYCPLYSNDTNSVDKNSIILNDPIVTIQWMSMTSYNSISNVSNIISDANSNKQIANQDRKSNGINLTFASKSLASLRYSSLSSNFNRLYLYNGTNKQASLLNINCSCNVLFFNENIPFPNQNTLSTIVYNGISSLNTYYSLSTKSIYIKGKKFSNIIISSSGNSSTSPSNFIFSISSFPLQSTSSYYYEGLSIPNHSSFLIQDYISLIDNIGYYCQPNSNDNNYITNFIPDMNGFLLDLNSEELIFQSSILKPDRNEDLIMNDKGSHIQFSFLTPYEIPTGSIVSFSSTSNIFSSSLTDTICAISDETLREVQCSSKSNGEFQCKVNSKRSYFQICCHNIYNNISNGSSNLYITSLKIDYSPNPFINTYSDYVSLSPLSSLNTSVGFSYNTSLQKDVLSINPSTISIQYEFFNQENAFGGIVFEVSLGRSLSGNMRIEIITDLSKILIPNINTICRVGYGNQFDIGYTNYSSYDESSIQQWSYFSDLIEECIVTSTKIVITTKSLIPKCGQNLNSNIYVRIHPIYEKSIDMTVKVVVLLKNSKAEIANSQNSSVISIKPEERLPIQLSNIEKMFSVSTKNPFFIEENNTFLIVFDINTLKIKENLIQFQLESPNEIILYLPIKVFGRISQREDYSKENLICFIGNTIKNCYFLEFNVLIIYSEEDLLSSNLIELKIINLTLSENSFTIAGSLSYYNKSTKSRKNIMNGSGIFLTTSQIPTRQGNLFMSNRNLTSNSSLTPRTLSDFSFRLYFDRQLDLPMTIFSPILVFTFPFEYMFSINTLINIKYNTNVNVYLVSFDETNKNLSKVLIQSRFTLDGNSLYINIDVSDFIIEVSFAFIEISCLNLLNPSEDYETTGRFKAYITNNDKSLFYKVYTNIDSSANESYPLLNSNDLLLYNRGIGYKYDNKQWVVDVVDPSLLSLSVSSSLYNTKYIKYNYGYIKTGRYTMMLFRHKQNKSLLISPSSSIISIENKTFKLNQEYFTISSSLYEDIPFYIGCKCNTSQGIYYINFKSTSSTLDKSNSYSYIIPFTAYIKIDKGVISYKTDKSIVSGGSTFIYYSLSDRTYEEITVEFNENSSFKVSSSTVIPFEKGGRAVIKHMTNASMSSQVLSLKPIIGNSCFSYINTELTIRVDGYSAVIPNNSITIDDISILNYNSDPSLTKDSIKLIYKSSIKPIYLYCVLVCEGDSFPSDDETKSQVEKNVIDYQIEYNNSRLIYISYMISQSNEGYYSITVNRLLRGFNYKAKCFFESTNSDLTRRTVSIIEIDKLSPSSPSLSSCALINFSNNPDSNEKSLLVHYCQYLFSNVYGFSMNGCVICTDLYGNKAPGLDFSYIDNYKKNSFLVKTNVNTNQTSDKYTICPIPSATCQSDVSGEYDYDSLFKKFVFDIDSSAKIANLLKISVQINNIDTFIDKIKPELRSNIGIKHTNAFQNGTVDFTLTYPSSLQCYYLINNHTQSNPPSSIAVQTCENQNRCGFIRVNSAGTRKRIEPNSTFSYKDIYNTNSSYINITDWNQTYFNPGIYQIWVSCFNDIPYPQLDSEVISIYNFYISKNNSECLFDCESSTEKSSLDCRLISSVDLLLSLVLICVLFL